MAHPTAVDLALHVHRHPSVVHACRAQPLPPDVHALLTILANEDDAPLRAAQTRGLSAQAVTDAAAFFVTEIVLMPGADSYRLLASSRTASAAELRRNMALLMRWLHPDLNTKSPHAASASRVLAAWETLKTPERRSTYDHQLQPRPHVNTASTSPDQSRIARKRKLRQLLKHQKRNMIAASLHDSEAAAKRPWFRSWRRSLARLLGLPTAKH